MLKMRITKIEIIHFGKLSNQSFELGPNLNIFYGANEAGKSTTVAFIKQVLFGFHLRSVKSPFFEDYKPLKRVSPMGGRLYFEDHDDQFVLERLYVSGDSKKGVLKVWLNDQEVPENIFFDRIKNIEGDFYTDSFIFNQEMLSEVHNISQADLMERIYFLGASQSNKLLALRKDFSDEASELFKRTGKKPVINQLLNQIEKQKEEVAKNSTEFAEYQDNLKKQEALNQELDKSQEDLNKLTKQLENLRLLQQKLGNYRQYEELSKQVTKVNFSEPTYDKVKSLEAEINRQNKDLRVLQENLKQLEINQPDKENIAKAQSLIEKKAEFLQWRSEYDQLQKNNARIQSEIQQLEEISPESEKLAQLNKDQIAQLREAYQELHKPQEKQKTSSLPLIGGGLIVLGIVLGIALGQWFWYLLAIVGGGLIWYDHSQKDSTPQPQTELFGISLENINLDSALTRMVQLKTNQENYQANQIDLKNLADRINQYQGSVNELLTKLAVRDLESFLSNVRQANVQKQQLQSQIQLDKDAGNRDKQALQSLLLDIQVKSIDELEERRKQALAQEKLQLNLQALKNNIGDDYKQLKSFNEAGRDFEEQEAVLTAQVQNAQKHVNELQSQLAELKVSSRNLTDSDAVFAQNQNLANLKSQLKDESITYLSNLLASNWIGRSLDLASNERFPKMINSAQKYFSILTGQRYKKIIFDKKIKVVSADNKETKEVKYLSRATSEQLYFALKLAFVEQIADDISLPILIDDAFVDFDAQRTEYISELVKNLSSKMQVLIFTHRKNLVEELDGDVLEFSQE